MIDIDRQSIDLLLPYGCNKGQARRCITRGGVQSKSYQQLLRRRRIKLSKCINHICLEFLEMISFSMVSGRPPLLIIHHCHSRGLVHISFNHYAHSTALASGSAPAQVSNKVCRNSRMGTLREGERERSKADLRRLLLLYSD